MTVTMEDNEAVGYKYTVVPIEGGIAKTVSDHPACAVESNLCSLHSSI
jgi:hypothetical protein